jgi:hypothetical protein
VLGEEGIIMQDGAFVLKGEYISPQPTGWLRLISALPSMAFSEKYMIVNIGRSKYVGPLPKPTSGTSSLAPTSLSTIVGHHRERPIVARAFQLRAGPARQRGPTPWLVHRGRRRPPRHGRIDREEERKGASALVVFTVRAREK